MTKPKRTTNVDVADRGETTTFSQSDGLVRLLAQQGAAIMFSSYQSGLLYMLGHIANGGAHLHQSAMAKPMGIWVEDDNAFTLSAGYQIMRFKNGLEPHERVNQQFDACFAPRETQVTGELDAHDIGVDRNGQPIFVNTRFNCLATTDPRHSFRELWRPPFISALVDEDRCHLNGLAMENGEAAYVTAVSRSDTIDGWRDRRDNGGVVIDVRSGAIVCEGLSMPHSPRWHDGKLWVLQSGLGTLSTVDSATGSITQVAELPGFTRGLAFIGRYALVGLSQVRESVFAGLPITSRADERNCGVWVVDTQTGAIVGLLRFRGAVQEIFDVKVLPGATWPTIVTDPEVLASSFVLSPAAMEQLAKPS